MDGKHEENIRPENKHIHYALDRRDPLIEARTLVSNHDQYRQPAKPLEVISRQYKL